MTTWADTILSEAQTGKLECTVHDDYKEEEKERVYFTLSHSAVFSCQLKKYTVRELQVKFCLRQNEDCSLGDSVSDSSEKLLKGARRTVSIYVVLAKVEYTQLSTLFFAEGFCWS